MAHQTYQKSFDNHHIRRRVTITQRRVYGGSRGGLLVKQKAL